MTPEQIDEVMKQVAMQQVSNFLPGIADAIHAAVLAERERCARIAEACYRHAETRAGFPPSEFGKGSMVSARAISSTIRNQQGAK